MRRNITSALFLGALVLFAHMANAAVPSAERDALIALYNATGGASWTDGTGWLGVAGTECDWFGVDCDDAGVTVTTLYLEGNNLAGTLPGSSLAALKSLETLGLARNSLSGSIPTELGSLSKLQSLYLYENQLTGGIPSALGNPTALRELSLSSNQLSGAIPAQLGNLVQLQYLWLDHNQLTGSLPDALMRLPLLDTLTLGDNQLSGSIPSSIGQMKALRELRLESNRFEGSIPAEIGSLTNLEFLDLSLNALTGSLPQQITSLTNLQYLYIGANQLTGSIPSGFSSLTKLLELLLSENQLTGSFPLELTQLTSLTRLELGSTNLGGAIPPQIGNLSKLEYLGLGNAAFEGSIPPEIGQLTALRSLELYQNRFSGAIPSQIGQLRALETLSLGGNAFTGTLPAEIANLTALINLDAGSNKLSGPIPSQLASLKELVNLSLYDNQFTGTIPAFLGSLTKLEDLNLGYNKLTGTIPLELMQLTNLTGLELGNNLITGTIPPQIGNLTKLVYLGFGDDDLEGSIPAELGQLTALRWMYLYENRFSGSIPSQIGNLTALEALSLSSNSLTGSIPREIGNLANIKYLELANNGLTGTIPSEIGNLTLLENLVLEENQLEGSIPSLASLSNLGLLSLSYNRLSGSIPSELSNLTRLEYLLLGYNSLTGSIPSSLGALSSLQIMTLDRNLLSGAIPSSLGNLRNLRVLALAVNSLQGEIPAEMANLTGLTAGDLDLNYNGLYTTSSSLRTFLNSKNYGGDWEGTQTITPTGVAVSATTGTSAVLTWNRIKYYWDDGGYEIFVSATPDATTPDRVVTSACKELTSEIITGLSPQTKYYFKIRAVTYAHDDQQGTLRSPFSATVSGTTVTATVQPPNIVVTTLPYGMVQDAGAAGGYDYFVLTNVGDAETTIAMTVQGSFFSLDETTVAIGAGESAYVNVTGIAQSAGAYEGSVLLSGTGVKSGASIPIYLLSVVPPTGSVIAEAAVTRVDLIAPESENPRGTVDFTNSGEATLNGIVVSDAEWIVPQDGLVTIAPGGTATVSFSIDRSRRPDAGGLSGAVSGNLSLLYADGRQGAKKRGVNGEPPAGTSVSTVTIVDTVQTGATATPIPPLATDEIALFVPGIAQRTSGGTFLTDVSIANAFGSSAIKDLKLYYAQAGPSAQTVMSAVPSVGVNQGLKLANILQSVFGKQAQVGTLHLRTRESTAINVFARVINTSSNSGTFGTAAPVIRSDRAARPTQRISLTGLRGDTGYKTDLYLQETSGSGATAQVEFLDAAGARVETVRAPDTIGAFSLLYLQSVPAGAVSARITVGATGRIAAYATITDTASGDTWTVLDWARQYDFIPTEPQIVPAVGALGSAGAGRQRAIRRGSGTAAKGSSGFVSELAVMNSGTTAASATLRFHDGSSTASKTISLQPGAAKIITDAGSFFGRGSSAKGYVQLEPQSGSFAMTSRIYSAGAVGTYSSAVPVVSARTGVRYGQTKAMAGLDDSRKVSATQEVPGTYTTSFVLLETAGKPVKLRITLSYSDGRFVVAAIGQASRDFSLAARQFQFVPNIAAAILGSSREASLGDLDNVKVSFQVIEGDGAAVILTTSTDNASGDPMVRFE